MTPLRPPIRPDGILAAVGNTPLVRLRRLAPPGGPAVWAKVTGVVLVGPELDDRLDAVDEGRGGPP